MGETNPEHMTALFLKCVGSLEGKSVAFKSEQAIYLHIGVHTRSRSRQTVRSPTAGSCLVSLVYDVHI